MRLAIFGHSKRPQVDSQNTGRDAYTRPFGVGTVSVQGQGGTNNMRSLSPVSPTGFNPAFVGITDIMGAGSAVNTNPELQPLINKSQSGPQF